MERELMILEEIHNNNLISQRQLSRITGLSLGTINSIVQKFAHDELITVKQLNPKSTKYTLTSLGKKVKAEKAYQHIVDSYQTIGSLKVHIKDIITEQLNQGIDTFYLCGKDDEIYRLIKMCLIECKRNYKLTYQDIHTEEDISSSLKLYSACMIYWNPEQIPNTYYQSVNILYE